MNLVLALLFIWGVLLHHYADGFDLQGHVLGKAGYLHAGTGGLYIAVEPFGIDLVHGGEIVHILEEYGGFDHVLQVASAGLQNGLEVFDALLCLGLNAFGHETVFIGGNLAGNEHKVAQLYACGIGAESGGRAGEFFHGRYSFFWRQSRMV